MPKLTATGSRFETFMEGWLIAPDAGCSTHGFAYLEILEVTGANSLTVKGDLTTMLAGDERFWIFAPPSVDAQTGAIRGTYTGSTFQPAKCDSRYLWAQYRYMPPMAGYEVNPGTPGTYGRQPGTNQAGTYHAWNRQYDPSTGRWTTPDPAASPWGNLWEYVGSMPVSRSDSSGLKSFKIDDKKCTITMNFSIQLQFKDGPTLTWRDEKEKENWAMDALDAITRAFNKRYKLKGKEKYDDYEWGFGDWCIPEKRWFTVDCPCPAGYTVMLDLSYTIDGVYLWDDYELQVIKRTTKEAEEASEHTLMGGSDAWVSSDSNKDYTYKNGITQKTVVHEFGHMIGLHHPNPGAADEYTDPVTGKPSRKLMGYGMEGDPSYVKAWKDHLDAERPECGDYTAELIP